MEGRERPHAIVVGEVLEDVRQDRKQGIGKEQLPSWRKLGLPPPPRHQTIDSVNAAHHSGRNYWRAQQCVGKTAMVRKSVHRPTEICKYVQVRRLSGQDQGEGGKTGLAVQPRAA